MDVVVPSPGWTVPESEVAKLAVQLTHPSATGAVSLGI